jgi:hypothetical protein
VVTTACRVLSGNRVSQPLSEKGHGSIRVRTSYHSGDWILAMNIQRRQLVPEQRGAIVAQAYKLITALAKERRYGRRFTYLLLELMR